MKKILFIALLSCSGLAAAQAVLHQGYVRRDGAYVQPHYQTQPDRNPYNNYSTQGNVNPYTGQTGTRDPYQVQQQYAPPPNNYGNTNTQQRRRGSW